MSKKHVIFFPDNPHELTPEIKAELSKTYSCFQSNNPDEYSQTFHQSGKFVLLFSDAQEAVKFLQKSSQELMGLEFKTYAFINKMAKFSSESQKILDRFKINVFLRNESSTLMTNIKEYFSGKGEALDIDDIQFIMPKDD